MSHNSNKVKALVIIDLMNNAPSDSEVETFLLAELSRCVRKLYDEGDILKIKGESKKGD